MSIPSFSISLQKAFLVLGTLLSTQTQHNSELKSVIVYARLELLVSVLSITKKQSQSYKCPDREEQNVMGVFSRSIFNKAQRMGEAKLEWETTNGQLGRRNT